MYTEVIICQPDRSPERLMIYQTPSIGGASNHLRWEKECGGNSPSFWGEFCKTFLCKIGYSKPSKIVAFWTFYSFVFVNMTNIVVKNYTVLYMGVEVIICQSEMSPERLISHTPSIGGTSNQLRWERECGGNSPRFWGDFCKNLPTQNRIFKTFQNCGILNLAHVCICQYHNYGSE